MFGPGGENMPNKRHRFLVGFVDAMKEVLDSLKPPVHLPISNDVQVSNAADSRTDLDTDEKNEKPESEDEVQAAPPAESRRHQPALHSAAGLEDKVPTVRVDKDGHAYLTECEVVFPNRDEVWLIAPVPRSGLPRKVITQTGHTTENFKSMRTVCQEIGGTNAVQYISRKDFFALDDLQLPRLIERPLVIAGDSPREGPLYVQRHPASANGNPDGFFFSARQRPAPRRALRCKTRCKQISIDSNPSSDPPRFRIPLALQPPSA